MRTNAGYEIVSAIRIREDEEIVLGCMKTKSGNIYVTWCCSNGDYYFWGNYFSDFESARNDHIIRAASSCGLKLVKECV